MQGSAELERIRIDWRVKYVRKNAMSHKSKRANRNRRKPSFREKDN